MGVTDGAGDQCQDGKFPPSADHGTTLNSLKRTHPRLVAPTAWYAGPCRGAWAARGTGWQGEKLRAALRGETSSREGSSGELDTAEMYRRDPNDSMSNLGSMARYSGFTAADDAW